LVKTALAWPARLAMMRWQTWQRLTGTLGLVLVAAVTAAVSGRWGRLAVHAIAACMNG
jgi:hypothetical protein